MRAAPGDVVRSLIFYPVFYFGSIFYVVAAALLLAAGSPRFRRAVVEWSHYHRLCAELILRITVVIEGDAPRGGYFYAIKHESFFEAIDLPWLLPEPVVFAKAGLMAIPLWGYAANSFGVVGVERQAGASALRAMLTAARRLTANGRPLAIFPEGTRVIHGSEVPLQAGFAGLYKLIAMPVIPVAVNSGPLYHRLWKRRGTITMRFGEPIPAGLPRDRVEAQVHAAINALNA